MYFVASIEHNFYDEAEAGEEALVVFNAVAPYEALVIRKNKFQTLASPTCIRIKLPNLLAFFVYEIYALDAIGFIRADSSIDTLHRTLFVKIDSTRLFETAAFFFKDWRRDIVRERALDRANFLLVKDLFESHRGEVCFLGGFLELFLRRPLEVDQLRRHLFTPKWKFLQAEIAQVNQLFLLEEYLERTRLLFHEGS